jgi:hypothetical protein
MGIAARIVFMVAALAMLAGVFGDGIVANDLGAKSSALPRAACSPACCARHEYARERIRARAAACGWMLAAFVLGGLRCAQTARASLTLLRCAAAENRISNLLAGSKYNGRRLLGYGCARPARACCVSANKVDAAACR